MKFTALMKSAWGPLRPQETIHSLLERMAAYLKQTSFKDAIARWLLAEIEPQVFLVS